ncbi:MAG: J domain-containing protein [Rubripirellula sp.]
MSDGAGDWDHLPHDPLAFFGLAEGFERRDLKRAYGRLIRQFKPETHPAEFQRIRAAYEQLENANRYGRSQQAAEAANSAWEINRPPSSQGRSEDSASGASHRTGRDPAKTAPPPLVDVARSKPRETYQRLQEKGTRTPQEYYVLAVLSDLLKLPEGGKSFIQWLLLGLKSHPSDPGLTALVAQYLRTDVSVEEAPRVRKSVASALRSPLFYRLTESLWERLLREQDFERFYQLLEPCERLIRQTDPRARWAFYLRILRTAIWKAPPDWTEARLGELESEAAQFEGAMEQDLEFLALLRNHLKSQPPQLAALPARARIDHLLHEHCNGDGPAAVASMTHGFSEIARDAHGMRFAFPMNADARDADVFLLIVMVSADLAETAGISPPPANDAKNDQQAVSAFRDLLSTLSRIGNQITRLDFRYKWITFLTYFFVWSVVTVFFVALPMAFLPLADSVLPIGLFVSMAICVLSFIFYVFPKHLKPRLQAKQQECLMNAYESQWRERLFRYVQSCGEPANASFHRLRRAAKNQEESHWVTIVLSYCEADLGLLMFARAQMFVA